MMNYSDAELVTEDIDARGVSYFVGAAERTHG